MGVYNNKAAYNAEEKLPEQVMRIKPYPNAY
jgi:hypothetical protein